MRSGQARPHRCSPRTPGCVGAAGQHPQAKRAQLIYGFYPESRALAVNLALIWRSCLLLPLLIPRLPAEGAECRLSSSPSRWFASFRCMRGINGFGPG